jgi:flavin reductase (DIM6/NTAB) family NADH-FMN oxidoreductase RutF
VTSPSSLAVPSNPGGFVRPEVLRSIMRQHCAGVAVITTGAEEPIGFCATSLSSVSLEPPTICFAVATESVSGRAWRDAVHGIVHLLRSDQAAVASAFARSGPGKFAGAVGWRCGPCGQPLLDNVLAWMLVSPRTRLVVGDHLLVVCYVIEATVEPRAEPEPGPLIHHDGGFHCLPPIS